MQLDCPAEPWYFPAVHVLQTAFAAVVHGGFMYFPALHDVHGLQTLSAPAVHCAAMYFPVIHAPQEKHGHNFDRAVAGFAHFPAAQLVHDAVRDMASCSTTGVINRARRWRRRFPYRAVNTWTRDCAG
jgi:hypothetical protein